MSYLETTKTVQDVANYVKRQFGDESGVQITDDDIFRWIDAGQAEIFRRNEPVKSSSSTDLVSGKYDYEFPGDILKIQSLLVNGVPVPFRSYQEAEEYVLANDPSRTQTGQPQIWYEWGGVFTLWPTPDLDAASGIVIKYIAKPTSVNKLSDFLTVPDVYFNRLIEFVLQQAYELDENWNAADMKASQFGTNLDSQKNQGPVQWDTYPTITVLDEDL